MRDYLASRSIEIEPYWPYEIGNPYMLGVVDTPVCAEHEPYVGWISIPFLVPVGAPVGMKFRRPPGTGSGSKYMSHPGTGQRLFGVRALQTESPVIGITEGEFDAIVLNSQVDIPAVAVPGVNAWKPEWVYLLEGYEQVLVFGDGDQPGRQFADQLAGEIGARAIPMPNDHDVSSFVTEFGPGALRTRAGL